MARKPMTADTTIATDTTNTTDTTDMTDAAITANVSTPIAPEFDFDASDFAGGEGEVLGLEIKYPSINFLNAPKGKTQHGLFIKESALVQSGWVDPQFNYTHRYNRSTEDVPGILFNEDTLAPRMLILRKSPRYVEVTQKGEENVDDIRAMLNQYLPAAAGMEIKASTLVHNFDTPSGQEFYSAMREFKPGLLSLRTFYLVLFVDQNNKCLHNIPFKLSMKGASAASFGPAVEQMQLQGVLAFSKKYGKALGASYLPLLVFEPKIVGDMAGEKDQSLVCKVASFTPITSDNFTQMFAGVVPETKSHVMAFLDASEGFTAKAIAGYQEEGFHQLAPGVEAIDVQALPAASYETDED